MVEITTSPRTARVERFRFNALDEPSPAPVAPPPAPVPGSLSVRPASPEAAVEASFTAHQIETACAEARRQGYQEGHGAALKQSEGEKAAREESVRALLDVIANRITIAAEAQAARVREQQDLNGRIIVAIARKVAGEALKKEPYAPVEALLRSCAALVEGQTRIVIAVAPARAEALRQRTQTLRSLLPAFAGDIAVEEDADFAEHDCRVEWRNAYAERGGDALWREIEALISQATLSGREA